MKTSRFLSYAAIAFVLGLAVMLTAGVSLLDLFSAVTMGGSVTLAMAGAAGAPEGTVVTKTADNDTGTVTTKEQREQSELLENTVSKRITEMRPSNTPLDTIIRKNSIVVPIKSWETEYFAVDMRGIEDSLAANVTVPDDETPTDIKVVNFHIWSTDDVIKFNDIPGSDNNRELLANVVDTDAGDKELKVIFLNYPDAPVVVDEGTKITRIGNAKGEKDAQTDPYAILPQLSSNFCQIHMAQVEEGVYAKLHEKKVKWDIEDYKMQALYDMRRNMELTSLFGFKKRIYDPVGKKEKHLSGGLTRYIDKYLDYPGTLDNDAFVDWTKTIFTGNAGSDTRFMFIGDELVANISKIDTVQKQIEAKSTEVVHGVTFNKIETNFGTLLVKHHPLLSFAGWGDRGIVLDMNNIEKHVLKSMDTRQLELIKSGQRNVNAYVVDEAFCLVLRYPETHALIRKVDPT